MAKGKGKEGGGALECCAICGAATFCCFIVLVVLALLGLGIAKIVLGAIYLHDCSIEPKIPIYLIVSGVAPILLGGFGRNNSEDSDQGVTGGTICGLIGFLFNLAWTICGSVWVYPNYGTIHSDKYVQCTGNMTTDCTHGNCNGTLLSFSFAMVTLDWICIGLWILVVGCTIVRACKGRN